MRPNRAALKTAPNWFGAMCSGPAIAGAGHADGQKVESVEQRHQTAQHDNPDLQSPEGALVD
jgi:hypothetical protein